MLPATALWFDAWPFLVAAALFAVIFRPSMREEDRYLAERFGEEHARYVARVPAVVPVPRIDGVTDALRWVAGALVAFAAWWLTYTGLTWGG